jgi:uncharacterized membrane protein YuzA (DUF378 family)
MGTVAKLSGVVTIFGALNWAALGLFDHDVVKVIFGDRHTPVTNGMMIVVAMGAMFMLAIVAKPKKD